MMWYSWSRYRKMWSGGSLRDGREHLKEDRAWSSWKHILIWQECGLDLSLLYTTAMMGSSINRTWRRGKLSIWRTSISVRWLNTLRKGRGWRNATSMWKHARLRTDGRGSWSCGTEHMPWGCITIRSSDGLSSRLRIKYRKLTSEAWKGTWDTGNLRRSAIVSSQTDKRR